MNDSRSSRENTHRSGVLRSRSFMEPVDLPAAEKRKIDMDAFWDILADMVAEIGDDSGLRYDALSARLMRYNGPSIRNFARHYERVLKSFCHHDVTALLAFAYHEGSVDFFFNFVKK